MRHHDEHFITPWMGFPYEENPLMLFCGTLTVLLGLWILLMHFLKNRIEGLMGTNYELFTTSTLIPVLQFTYHWGGWIALGAALLLWEGFRTEKYRRAMGF